MLKGFMKYYRIRILFIFSANPKSVEDEIKFLEGNEEKRKHNIDHNFAILYEGKVVGGCGAKIDQHRPYIAEIGYFLDEAYWKKGIATQAVKLIEEFLIEKLNIKRIEILMLVDHKASEKSCYKIRI